MTSPVINAEILETHLCNNFAKLAALFCYILWQQQGIYIQPYESFETLSRRNPDLFRKGIRSLLISFETLKVDPAVYLNFNVGTGLLEEKMSLQCEDAVAEEPPTFITDLLFDSKV